MAHAQKKSFSSENANGVREQTPGPQALAATPFALWSNMAEMQQKYLASVMQNATNKLEQDGNVTELRPNALAGPAALISQNWMTAAAECQRELAHFLKDRLSKNQTFMANVMGLPAGSELVQLQTNWLTETAQDYTSEFEKLSGILKNGADEAIAATA